VEPKAQDFGLSPERAKKLQEPLKLGCVFSLFFFPVFFFALVKGAPLLGDIGIILWIAWPLTLLVALLIPIALAEVWARSQPDYPAYKQYKAEYARYRSAIAIWVRQQREWWLRLDGRSFEVEAGTVFRRRGYTVRRVGGSGDQGVDLLLTKDGLTIAVQCKAHRNPVGPGAIRDLYGAMVHHRHREAWILSTTGFTRGAKAFAAGKPIRLLTLEDLL
jgi:hypothetical protein